VVVYRQDRRRRLTLVLLVITSLVLISLDERGSAVLDSVRSAAQDVIAPVQGVVDDLVDPAADFIDSLGRADELAAENSRLRNRIAELQGEVESAASAVAENRTFREILDIPQIEDINFAVATVVSGSVDNFHRTWRIDKGSASGLAVDMPVVVGGSAGAALVGRVAAVASDSATVQRIDDRSFGAGAQLVENGELGPLGGVRGIPDSRLLQFQLSDSTSDGIGIEKGQSVVTSGIECSRYPKGLPIGTVLRSIPATAATARNTRLEPLVDLDAVDIVKVLFYVPPTPVTCS
jgi:rod shape-determining protein MreC